MLSERKIDSGADQESERTCAGCRRRDASSSLLRFAITSAAPRLLPDPLKRLPGRGVSVHPNRACIRRAVGGGLARALQGQLETDAEQLCATAAEQYRRRVDGLLLAASRTKTVALGTEAVQRAIGSGEAMVVIFARDAAGKREDLEGLAQAREIPCRTHGTKMELGRLFGRPELGVLAILDRGIAHEVATAALRATQLLEAE